MKAYTWQPSESEEESEKGGVIVPGLELTQNSEGREGLLLGCGKYQTMRRVEMCKYLRPEVHQVHPVQRRILDCAFLLRSLSPENQTTTFICPVEGIKEEVISGVTVVNNPEAEVFRIRTWPLKCAKVPLTQKNTAAPLVAPKLPELSNEWNHVDGPPPQEVARVVGSLGPDYPLLWIDCLVVLEVSTILTIVFTDENDEQQINVLFNENGKWKTVPFEIYDPRAALEMRIKNSLGKVTMLPPPLEQQAG